MFIKLKYIFIYSIFIPFFIFADSAKIIVYKKLTYSKEINVHIFSEKSASISNPVNYLPISYIIPDGTKVKKGQIITKFDTKRCKFEYQNLLNIKKLINAQLINNLSNIDEKKLGMKDQLDNLKDQLGILNAKKEALYAIPYKADVKVAESRYKIAKMNFDIAKNDYNKSTKRLQKNMISKGEMQKFKLAYLKKKYALEFAEKKLNYKKLTCSESTLKINSLEISNIKMEIKKLTNEIKEYNELAKLKKKTAKSRKKRIITQLKKKKEDLDNTIVKAPIAGYIKYGKIYYAATGLGLGSRMWKNYIYMSIPDLRTLALKGNLSEIERRFFSNNDKVEISFYAMPKKVITGKIKSISKLSKDLAEKDVSSWGKTEKSFGIKVFEMILSFDDTQFNWVRPGMRAKAKIISSKSLEGPVIPIEYVKNINAINYISINSIYQQVTGTLVGNYFLLDNKELLGKKVTMNGVLKKQKKSKKGYKNNRFMVSGELLPLVSRDIIVGNIGWQGGWPKVTWLSPEGCYVKKGDIVAKLDTKEKDLAIDEREDKLTNAQNNVKELKKEYNLSLKKNAFKLKYEKNKLEISLLKKNITDNSIDYLSMIEINMKRKEILANIDYTEKKLKNISNKKITAMSPVAINNLKRDLKKQKLQYKKTIIRLNTIKMGNSIIEKSKAKLQYLKQLINFEIIKKEVKFDIFSANKKLEMAEIKEEKVKAKLEKIKKQRELFTIKSPANGTLTYNKIWDSGEIKKVHVGSIVGRRFNILKIPDFSKMTIKLDIPEKYYSKIKIGLILKVVIPSISTKELNASISSIDFIFINKEKKNDNVGLYSSHEPIAEVNFKADVILASTNIKLKPGTIVDVYFPFSKDSI